MYIASDYSETIAVLRSRLDALDRALAAMEDLQAFYHAGYTPCRVIQSQRTITGDSPVAADPVGGAS